LTDRLDAYSLQGWSPDSQWLYYMVGFTIAPELYRMRADGSSPEKVSFTAKNDAPPQFAPASAADFSPFWLTLAVIGLMILSTIGNLRR